MRVQFLLEAQGLPLLEFYFLMIIIGRPEQFGRKEGIYMGDAGVVIEDTPTGKVISTFVPPEIRLFLNARGINSSCYYLGK